MSRALTALRDLYRREWRAQSNFGPKHTLVLKDWHRKHALVHTGPLAAPRYVFHVSRAIRSKWLPTFTNGDAPFAFRRKGDVVVDALLVRTDAAASAAANRIKTLTKNAPLWLDVLPDDQRQNRVVKILGATRVGTRHTAEGDVFAVWYREGLQLDDRRPMRLGVVEPAEQRALVRLSIALDPSVVSQLRTQVDAILDGQAMAEHYSKKNKGKDWSALSLYGFSDDAAEIAKPTEVSAVTQNPRIRATRQLKRRPALKRVVDKVIQRLGVGIVSERVRLMRLAGARTNATSAEVQRHSDLTDKAHGVRDGRIVRIHVPITTNPKATISVWDENNREHAQHLPCGGYYYLDARRPHRVLNAGQQDRVHLVIDVRSNHALRTLLVANGTELVGGQDASCGR